MISYEDGYLRIYSPTEGAKCCYTITADDAVTNKKLEVGNPFVKLSGSYSITAYANAEGYLDSDIVSAMLYWHLLAQNRLTTSIKQRHEASSHQPMMVSSVFLVLRMGK